jgi:hypothetical protein
VVYKKKRRKIPAPQSVMKIMDMSRIGDEEKKK